MRRADPQRGRTDDLPVAPDRAGQAERLTALLSIENLGVRFGAAPVVDDVSFTIDAGEKFALVGESGSGKSITALSVLGLVDGATTSGGSSSTAPTCAHRARPNCARCAAARSR